MRNMMNFKKRYQNILTILTIILICTSINIITNKTSVYAKNTSILTENSNTQTDIDYDEIQNVINDLLAGDEKIDFEDYVEDLITGKEVFTMQNVFKKAVGLVKDEIASNVSILGNLISIVIVLAIFTNLSTAFQNEQVSETGYYLTYLLLFTMLITSFSKASQIAVRTLESILTFMKVLVPAYFMSVGLSSGATTSLVFYEMALMIITIVESILIKLVIPMINIYLITVLVNNISKEDMLSKFSELLTVIINWSMKTMLGSVIGFNAVQGLILPGIDKLKRSTLLKVTKTVPVVGDAIGGVAETILGASILLKNAIGVTGIIIMFAIISVPMIQLVVIAFLYKCSTAVLQPISDKRVLESISGTSNAVSMLLKALFIGTVLFVLTITIVAVTTSG